MLSRKILLFSTAILSLSACSAAERLANVGSAPSLSRIENPAEEGRYRKVSMPMPQIEEVKPQQNSLWAGIKKPFSKHKPPNKIDEI